MHEYSTVKMSYYLISHSSTSQYKPVQASSWNTRVFYFIAWFATGTKRLHHPFGYCTYLLGTSNYTGTSASLW